MGIEITADEIYDSLFQSVGDGLRCIEGSIVEHWRWAKSEGLAVATVDGRAMLQAFPDKATDFLTVYETILAMPLDPSLTTSQRQAAVALRFTQVIDAVNSSLLAELVAIDPDFKITEVPYAQSRTTDTGVRAFEDWNPSDPSASGPAYNLVGRVHTLFPNFSTDFILYVYIDRVGSIATISEQRSMAEAKVFLNSALPAWVDFRVFRSVGFVLDQDPLDATAFGS